MDVYGLAGLISGGDLAGWTKGGDRFAGDGDSGIVKNAALRVHGDDRAVKEQQIDWLSGLRVSG